MIQRDFNKQLASIAQDVTKSTICNVKKINQGYYGLVYLVETDERPYIAKAYKRVGYLNYEESQLNELRKYAVTHVPEIIGKSLQQQNEKCDILFMEYIDGVNAGQLNITDEKERLRFGEEVIENLLSIHAVSNPNGFGDFVTGKYSERWEDYYKSQITSIYNDLQEKKSILSAAPKKMIDKLFNSYDRVFRTPVTQNSLIHGDYNLWNLMADPKTNRLIGMIDPLDCCYADRELELFQLENANGDRYGLMERYSENVQLSAEFELKKAYYRFWDDLKHFVNVGQSNYIECRKCGKIACDLLDGNI